MNATALMYNVCKERSYMHSETLRGFTLWDRIVYEKKKNIRAIVFLIEETHYNNELFLNI